MTEHQNYPGQSPQGQPPQYGQGYPQGYPQPYQQPPQKNIGPIAALITFGILGLSALIVGILFATGVLGSSNEAEPDHTTVQDVTTEAEATDTAEPTEDPTEDPSTSEEPSADETSDRPRVANPDDLPEGTVHQDVAPVEDLTFVETENYYVAELSDGSTTTGYRIVSANTDPADVEHVLTVFFDYSCPHCVDFEQYFADELTSYVTDGTIALELRPLSFLPPAYSSLGVNALHAVAEHDSEHLLAFHTALMEHSPEGTSAENPTDVILAAAESVGVSSEALEAFTTNQDVTWAESLVDFVPEGFKGTPTVLIDGVEVVIPSSSFADLLD